MPAKNKNPKIGIDVCPDCGALLLWRENVRGLAYAYCNGRDDPEGQACGMAQTKGKKTTEALKGRMIRVGVDLVPEPEPTPEPETQGNPKNDRSSEPNPWSILG